MLPKPGAVPINVISVASRKERGVRLLASTAARHDAIPLELLNLADRVQQLLGIEVQLRTPDAEAVLDVSEAHRRALGAVADQRSQRDEIPRALGGIPSGWGGFGRVPVDHACQPVLLPQGVPRGQISVPDDVLRGGARPTMPDGVRRLLKRGESALQVTQHPGHRPQPLVAPQRRWPRPPGDLTINEAQHLSTVLVDTERLWRQVEAHRTQVPE